MSEKSYLDKCLEDPEYKELFIREEFHVEVEERNREIAILTAERDSLQQDVQRLEAILTQMETNRYKELCESAAVKKLQAQLDRLVEAVERRDCGHDSSCEDQRWGKSEWEPVTADNCTCGYYELSKILSEIRGK